MKIIDGKNAILGRLASYVAKEALKGEEVVILNCEQVIVTGSRKDIKERFEEKRRRVGSSQKGPKHSKSSEKIVKRSIRGMLPDHRMGRGKVAFKRIKCYVGVPKEFQESKRIVGGKEKIGKLVKIRDILE
jgi:large subunit ribosomal protein L13